MAGKERQKRRKIKLSWGERIFMAVVYVVLTAFTLAALYPFVNVLAVSLSSSRAVGAGKVVLWPVEFNVDAYRQLLKDGQIFASMKNTIILTGVGTFLNVAATTLAAYALSKKRLRGRKIFIGMIVFTMLFSGGMIPNFVLIKSLKLMNTYSGLWLMGLISTYNMIVMKTSFEGLPEGLCEAAAIDGASEPVILGRIILPISKPVMATMVLFYAVGWWNAYFNPMLYLSSTTKFPMMVKLKQMLDTAKMIEVSAGEGLVDATFIVTFLLFIHPPFFIKDTITLPLNRANHHTSGLTDLGFSSRAFAAFVSSALASATGKYASRHHSDCQQHS